mmetsp:Transcript_6031/g.9419  ORF Transcript_6031/g.9419 Transcript_6031/m.9419 type:complete len:100 (-) Transcript_6031:50-349(-)
MFRKFAMNHSHALCSRLIPPGSGLSMLFGGPLVAVWFNFYWGLELGLLDLWKSLGTGTTRDSKDSVSASRPAAPTKKPAAPAVKPAAPKPPAPSTQPET